MTAFDNVEDFENAMSTMEWVEDPAWGMLDIINSPQKVEADFRAANPAVGDCDEFGQYAADRIQDMDRRDILRAQPINFMSVTWLDADGGFHGHNFCVFMQIDGLYHIGNWFDGKAQGPFKDAEAVARWWANESRGKGVLLGWATATPELRLDRIGLGP
jgi:hypothetical protein